jgi:abortive infection bacteriophage resistance protein
LEFWAKFGILGKVWNFGQILEFWAIFHQKTKQIRIYVVKVQFLKEI